MILLIDIVLDGQKEYFLFTISVDKETYRFKAKVITYQGDNDVQMYQFGEQETLLNTLFEPDHPEAYLKLYSVFRLLYHGERVELPFVLDLS